MRFEINFDKPQDQTEKNYDILESIKGVIKDDGQMYWGQYYIDINDLEDLKMLEIEIEKRFWITSMIVGFDQPTILLTEVFDIA